MKKVISPIMGFSLLAILMIALMSDASYAVPTPMFEQFANNIEEGRFFYQMRQFLKENFILLPRYQL